MALVRKIYNGEIKSVEEASGTVRAIVAGHLNVDRDFESLDCRGADFKDFGRNPVHGWAHDYSKLEHILGRAISWQIVPRGIEMVFRYALNTAAGSLAFTHIRDGNLSSYSVGFMPTEWVVPSPREYAQLQGKARRVAKSWSLWEVSLCGIPSNPDALVVGRTAGASAPDSITCPSCGTIFCPEDPQDMGPMPQPVCPSCGTELELPPPAPKGLSIGGLTIVSDRPSVRTPARALDQRITLVP